LLTTRSGDEMDLYVGRHQVDLVPCLLFKRIKNMSDVVRIDGHLGGPYLRSTLPGNRCSRMNVTALTPITTRIAWAIRRVMYPVTSSGAFSLRPSQLFVKYHSSGLMKP
jgi:hypothetical protein